MATQVTMMTMMMMMRQSSLATITLAFLLALVVGIHVATAGASASGGSWFGNKKIPTTTLAKPPNSGRPRRQWRAEAEADVSNFNPLMLLVRGGADSTREEKQSTEEEDDDDDEERYSRQVYTLGKRAHGLIRSSTVYLDGPPTSGLVYETAKNLALSGIRRIVLVVVPSSTSSESSSQEAEATQVDENYHNADMDDLGKAYMRAAKVEVEGDGDSDASATEILLEYIKRLNPSVQVSSVERSSLLLSSSSFNDQQQHDDDCRSARSVLVSIDRPYSTQVALNELVRQRRQSHKPNDDNNSMSFVAIETAGVFGRTFCDFGDSFQVFDADGETPLVTPLLRVERLNNPGDDEGDNHHQRHQEGRLEVVVHCIEGEKHDVSKGDQIKFMFRNGQESTEQCTVQEVQTPYRFVAKLEFVDHQQTTTTTTTQDDVVNDFITRMNTEASSFSRIKIPQEISFSSLAEATKSVSQNDDDSDLFTPCDLDKSFDPIRRRTCFACFQALSTFVEREGRLPSTLDKADFVALVKEEYGTSSWPVVDKDVDDKKARKRKKKQLAAIDQHITNFLHGCRAKLSPFQAVLGAIGAQETLKAATGLYFPVKQFLLYDCDEVLQQRGNSKTGTGEEENTSDSKRIESRGLRHLLGHDVVNELQEQKLFVVGAGAIGCEILKTLASMGVATRKSGRIVLTDMDTIEKSNLSRQLLFRDADLGKFKSTAAQEAVWRFHPSIRIDAHSSKVGASERHTPFDDSFWSNGVDIVLNALDNVDARVYMDGQCVANQKALVDAGTMGPKGNVQVVIPRQSESYASSVDPPEEGIPICTLKNFPYAISHTIQWGRDLFDGMFRRRPSQANDMLDSLDTASLDELASKLLRDAGEESAIQSSKELAEDLSVLSSSVEEDEAMVEKIRSHALTWATRLATKLYAESVDELLQQHPLDSLDEDNEPFWSGTRRPPRRLTFNAVDDDTEQAVINQNLIDFVGSAARLRVESFLSEKHSSFTPQEITEALEAISRNPDTCPLSTESNEINQSTLAEIRASLESVLPDSVKLVIAEFEKDDDQNGHVAFVTAASNLRAIGYGIPPVDAMETRRVAGNIVPAMISTTAFVSALSCIELIKLVQKAPLSIHRNAFINLALPFFAFTVPMPAEPVQGLQGKEYTLWDCLVIKEGKKAAARGGLTVKSLIKRIKKLAGEEDPELVDVVSISYGPYLLFANFLHEDDDEVLGSTLWDLVKEAVESEDDTPDRVGDTASSPEVGSFSAETDSLDLTVVVEDSETGDEAELPLVRLMRYKPKGSTAK